MQRDEPYAEQMSASNLEEMPSESILLLPPEALAVSGRRALSGLDQAPVLAGV